MKTKLKLFVFYVLSFAVSVAPLIITFIINRDKYISAPADTFKLCIGGTIAVVLIAIKALGKLKIPGGITLYGIVFALAYLLEAILADLLLLSGMALLGEIIDCAIFRPLIKRTKEKITITKTADATTEKVRAVFEEYMGRT